MAGFLCQAFFFTVPEKSLWKGLNKISSTQRPRSLTFNHDFIQQIILSAYYGADARRCWYIIVTMLDAVPGLVEESLVKKVGTHM